MDAHEVLCAARNLIDRGGWIQTAGAYSGPHCSVTAVFEITDEGSARPLRHLAAAAGVELDFPDDPGPEVGVWNDRPRRTKAEVLAAFDRAISATAPPPADPLPEVVDEPVAA